MKNKLPLQDGRTELVVKVDLDFAICYRTLYKKRNNNSNITYTITVLAILAVVIIVAVLVFFIILNINTTIEINAMRAELSTYELEKIKIDANKKALELAEKKQAIMNDVNSTIASHRMLSKKEIDTIYAALDKGVRVTSATYENSMLKLSCETESVYGPSNSAENLNDIGITAIVVYNGFTYKDMSKEKVNEDGERIIIQPNPLDPKTYIFQLICHVNPKETAVE